MCRNHAGFAAAIARSGDEVEEQSLFASKCELFNSLSGDIDRAPEWGEPFSLG